MNAQPSGKITAPVPWALVTVVVIILSASTSTTLGQDNTQQATLSDSYGSIGYEELSARLDGFASQLQNQADAAGHIVVYGPRGQGLGTGEALLRVQEHYLTELRGVSRERLKMTYAGRYQNPAQALTELWLVPAGVPEPQPKNYENKLKTAKGKFDEFDGYDTLSSDEEGPSLRGVSFAAYADTLRQQPQDLAYIVAFNSPGAAPGTWRRVATRHVSDLQERGIAADRIKIIFGGTSKAKRPGPDDPQRAGIELWILPEGAPPPIKEARPERSPKEAVQIGSYSDYQLKYPKDERWVFAGFADVLRADETVSICIIVRPRMPPSGQEDLLVLPDEPPDIDPLKLVEKWKSELTGKLGIKESRVIVLPATAEETNEGSVEVWAVPAGGALPNPYAHPEDPDPEP